MSQNQSRIVAETKVISRLTVFRPRKQANINGRIVDETAYLGSFKSRKGNTYIRLNVSESTPDGRGDFNRQYGRVVMFGDLARQLVSHIVHSDKGQYVTINAHARLQVVINVGRNGKEYTNLVWVCYGYEYDGNFYTTKKGVLSVGPSNRVNTQEAAAAEDDLFAEIEAEGGIKGVGGFEDTNTYKASTNYTAPAANHAHQQRPQYANGRRVG